jgi:hypothetical protein
VTFNEACVALATRTGMAPSDWADFLMCTPDQQAALARAYRDAQWVQSRNTFADVLEVLTVAATVAGAVTGIGSAITALKAL